MSRLEERADKFIKLYNQLDQRLRHQMDADRSRSFNDIVNRAAKEDPVVRHYVQRLKSYGALRNAIVHDADYPDEIIAEPNPETLSSFEHICKEIVDPPKLIPKFQTQVDVFDFGNSLLQVLWYMGKHDFSQVVLRGTSGQLQLLTTEGITRWLASEVEDDIVLTEDPKLGDALAYELSNNFVVRKRDDTIHHAREAFLHSLDQDQPRLYAVILTENGSKDEDPLGIVTPWDLIRVER